MNGYENYSHIEWPPVAVGEGGSVVFKKIIFQLHWFFGISAGLVLAVMGITGALYSFEGEITRALNAERWQIQPSAQGPLTPGELAAKIEAATADRVTALWVDGRHDGPGMAFCLRRRASDAGRASSSTPIPVKYWPSPWAKTSST